MLLILSTAPKTSSAKDTLHEISKSLKSNDTAHVVYHLEDVRLVLKKGVVDIFIGDENITAFTHIYFRKVGQYKDLANIIALFAKKQDISVMDTYHAVAAHSITKLIQYYTLAVNDIDIPHTIFLPQIKESDVDFIMKDIDLPVIVKALNSSQGAGVYLAKTREDLLSLAQKVIAQGQLCVVQEFISNSFDYRIVVLDGVACIAETKTRVNPDEFRNNVSLGGIEKFLPLESVDREVLHIAEQAAQKTFIDVAGVDVIQDDVTGRICILEINSAPQFTLGERISQEIPIFTNFLSRWSKKIS